MNVELIKRPADFEALREPWSQLLERAPIASVFLSWEWLWCWWKHYGESHELAILVAREGDAIVGILPTYVEHSHVWGALPLGVLRFLGTGGDTTPDDIDALLDPEHAPEAATALARAVLELPGWHQLRITDMAPESPFREALRGAMEDSPGLRGRANGMSARISYLNLPATWDAYVSAQSRNRRSKLKHRLKQQDVAFFVWDGDPPLERAFERLTELHLKRWTSRTETHAFSSPRYLAFHREVMKACHEKGWLRLYCMQYGGELIGMNYCYRFRNRVFYFQSGFDPSHSRLSPGNALHAYAIESAIGEGNVVFDMLRGEYEYKTYWAPERRETYQLTAFRAGPRALAARLRLEWLPELKRRLRARSEEAPPPAPKAADD